MNGSAMAGGVQISGQLAEWASSAGFYLTASDQRGRAVFSNVDGEIRYFVEAGYNGWFRVTSSHRAGSEQLELAAPLLSTIETYFYGFFGSDIRDQRQLARATPNDNRLSGRFEIQRLSNAGHDYPPLLDDVARTYLALYDAGQVTAVDGFGEVLARIRLSDLAVYLSAENVEEIKDSFKAPDGGTLLRVTTAPA
jgi:hypothetical protein